MAIKKISKIKVSVFKNPMYLIIGLLLVIIIILLINNYYINSKRKNVMERFFYSPDGDGDSSPIDECSNSEGNKSIDGKCICLKEENKDDPFEASKDNCINFTTLKTLCQKELCKGTNFTASADNCKNIMNHLTKDNVKDCCNNFFDSIENKSLCIPTDLDKFCITENQKYDYFNKDCCEQLNDDHSLKRTFCKEECTKRKTECNKRPNKEAKDMCMKNHYGDTNLNCIKYNV